MHKKHHTHAQKTTLSRYDSCSHAWILPHEILYKDRCSECETDIIIIIIMPYDVI